MLIYHHQLNGHEYEQTLGGRSRTEEPGMLKSMGSQRVKHDLATEQQQQIFELGVKVELQSL